MTKKTEAPVAAAQVDAEIVSSASGESDAQWARHTAINLALDHHRINGGMVPASALIESAKQFHAYITGESK